MISIKNLKLGYIREFYALYDINLEIQKGEKVAILGQEDSGKTSLLRVIAKLQKPTSGEITINEIPLNKINFAVDLSVAFLPSHPILFENKSVRKNIEYVLNIRQIPKEELLNLTDAILKDFALESYAKSKVKYLCLYHKRLLQFAMLSIRKKIDLLLIDDIFVGLNEKERKNIYEIAKSFIKHEDTTVLFATKDENIAKDLCSKIVKLHLGSIENEG